MALMMLNIGISLALAGVIHELGHFIVALGYGYFIQFEFNWGKLGGIPVPRYTWYMPAGLPTAAKQHVALAGFSTEFLVAPILYFILPHYPVIALIHLILYPFYAGEMNDFQWINDGFGGISKRGWMWLDALAFCFVCWTLVYYAGRALIRCFA